jgi:hypothetical protein
MQSTVSNHVRALPVLRRRLARSPAKPGSKKAVAVNALLAKPPKGAPEAVEARAVLMVRVFVSAPPDAVNETEGAAKLQEKYAGSVPQAKFTGPVRPPCGVIVKVTVPELANGIVRLAGFTVAVNPGVTTVSVKGADVLAVKFASPP